MKAKVGVCCGLALVFPAAEEAGLKVGPRSVAPHEVTNSDGVIHVITPLGHIPSHHPTVMSRGTTPWPPPMAPSLGNTMQTCCTTLHHCPRVSPSVITMRHRAMASLHCIPTTTTTSSHGITNQCHPLASPLSCDSWLSPVAMSHGHIMWNHRVGPPFDPTP